MSEAFSPSYLRWQWARFAYGCWPRWREAEEGEMTITGEQVARARYLLGWSRNDLAAKARLCETTIRNCENGKRPIKPSNIMAIRSALESAGVFFVEENGEGLGVRLRKGRR